MKVEGKLLSLDVKEYVEILTKNSCKTEIIGNLNKQVKRELIYYESRK